MASLIGERSWDQPPDLGVRRYTELVVMVRFNVAFSCRWLLMFSHEATYLLHQQGDYPAKSEASVLKSWADMIQSTSLDMFKADSASLRIITPVIC